MGRFANPTKLDECGSGYAAYEGEKDDAHAWSFLRTAEGRPGVPGVTCFSPYSDMVAATVAVVDGEDVGEQGVATQGE